MLVTLTKSQRFIGGEQAAEKKTPAGDNSKRPLV
jgi:hypothetical protein